MVLVACLLALPATVQALPFVPTTDPNSEDTQWYYLKTGYVYIYLNPSNFEVSTSSSASITNQYLWCFVGDDSSGYRIYNRYAENYMAMGWLYFASFNAREVDLVEWTGGNSFYIYFMNTIYNPAQKMYLAYNSNGFTSTSTKSTTFTAIEYVTPTTDEPVISTSVTDDMGTISASGKGTVLLYVDGQKVSNPYSVARSLTDLTFTVTATAQEQGKNMSSVTEQVTIPRLPLVQATVTPYACHTPNNQIDTLGNEGYKKMFDNDLSTKWCVLNPTGAWETIWVDFKTDEPVTPVMYALIPAEDTWEYSNRNPKTWKLYGKAKENDEWVVISEVADGSEAGLSTLTQAHQFPINEPYGTYQYFRYEVSAVKSVDWNNKYIFQMAEFQLLVYPVLYTATPTISYIRSDTDYTFNVVGDGETHLYVDSVEVEIPHKILRTNVTRKVTLTATAQEPYKKMSSETIICVISRLESPPDPDPDPDPLVLMSLTGLNANTPNNENDNYGNEGFAKLFDKNKYSKWCVVNSSGAWDTIWVDFKSAIPFIPTKYIFTTGNDTNSFKNRNPKAWKIHGKANENDDWTTLVSVIHGESAGLGIDNCADYTFDIEGVTTKYQYFRFEVDAIGGADQWNPDNFVFQLAELAFIGPTKGDITGDNKVDVEDVNAAINIILEMKTEADFAGSADLNGDNKVDVEDVNALINIILEVN